MMERLKKYWFTIPAITLCFSAASFLSIVIDASNLQICFSSNCWEYLLDIYSFPIQSLAATLVLVTLGLTIIRTAQAETSIQNQQKQINITAYHQFRNEYNEFFSAYEKGFRTIGFMFKDKFHFIYPQANDGIRTINQDIIEWLREDNSQGLYGELTSLHKKVASSDIETYYVSYYASTFRNIFLSFERLFRIPRNFDSDLYLENNNIEKVLISGFDSLNQRPGAVIFGRFSEILAIVKAIDDFENLKLLGSETLKYLNQIVLDCHGCLNKSMQWHDSYIGITEALAKKEWSTVTELSEYQDLINKSKLEKEFWVDMLEKDTKYPHVDETKKLLLKELGVELKRLK